MIIILMTLTGVMMGGHSNKRPSLSSPQDTPILRPRTVKNSIAEEFIGPSVSSAIGWKMYDAGKSTYLADFLDAVHLAAAPAEFAGALT